MKYTIIETFVGAGGAHIGFLKAGFKSLFVNDIDANCLKTLTFNNKELSNTNCLINSEDITLLDGKKVLEGIKLKPKDLDVMFGGIVCKGFSLAGERSPADPRNIYYRYQLNLVQEMKPKISIIENVPGILNSKILSKKTPASYVNKVDLLWKKIENYKGQKAFKTKEGLNDNSFTEYGKMLRLEKENLINELIENNYLISVKEDILEIYNSIGYKTYIQILNSADFGSATRRDRVIIVAVRNDINLVYEYPKSKFSSDNYVTVGDVLNQHKSTTSDEDDIPMNHNEKTKLRLRFLKPGMNFSQIIDKLPSDLKISKFYSRGSTSRLNPSKPAPTLVPGHSNFPIHPIYDRSITVREAALLTGFPKTYKFFGTHTKRCEQVGNAVPPNLSYAIALSAKKLLSNYYKNLKS
jgi:DNA (cytosine-5)-methyltransferase 1